MFRGNVFTFVDLLSITSINVCDFYVPLCVAFFIFEGFLTTIFMMMLCSLISMG